MRSPGVIAATRRRSSGGGGGGGGGGAAYRPYVDTSTYNTPIPASPPIHPLSSQMISGANYWLLGGTAQDQYKEWLGPRWRTLYWRGDVSTLPTVPVYVNFKSGTGYVCATTPKLNMPMPASFANILQGNSAHPVSGDLIVTIVDTVTGDEWEAWKITPPGMASQNISCNNARWNAITCNYFPHDVTQHNGYDLVSAVSESYIHMPAGLMIPEDFAVANDASAMNHALACFTHCDANGTNTPRFVAPAHAGNGFNDTGIPYGGRIQLDPSLNIDTWPSVNAKSEPWRSALKKILKTMQTYGFLMVDGTGGIGAGGLAACHPDSLTAGIYNGTNTFKYPWDAAGYGWSYANGIPYDLMDNFRVIDWTQWTGT